MASETEQTLISAVASDPDNLELRLVCADFFEEVGDSRCEVIRLWHEFVTKKHSRAFVRETELAIQEITFRDSRKWNRGVHRFLRECRLNHQVGRQNSLRGWKYSFGFVECLKVTGAFYNDHWDFLRMLGPIRELRVLAEDEGLLKLLNLPGPPGIERVFVTSQPGRHSEMAELAMHWNRPGVGLYLNGNLLAQRQANVAHWLDNPFGDAEPLLVDQNSINGLNHFDVGIQVVDNSAFSSQSMVQPMASDSLNGNSDLDGVQTNSYVQGIQNEFVEQTTPAASLGQRIRKSFTNVMRLFAKDDR